MRSAFPARRAKAGKPKQNDDTVAPLSPGRTGRGQGRFPAALTRPGRHGAGLGPAVHLRPGAGFMLLEVMVAFAIAALAVWMLADAGSTSVNIVETGARYEQALAGARSRLAMAAHITPLVAGDREGSDGGYTWHVRLSPLSTISVPVDSAFARQGSTEYRLALWSITVRVFWKDGIRTREVRLGTEQIREVAP